MHEHLNMFTLESAYNFISVCYKQRIKHLYTAYVCWIGVLKFYPSAKITWSIIWSVVKGLTKRHSHGNTHTQISFTF